MRIDEEGMALLNQYAEDFAIARGDAAKEGRSFDQSIHDAQIDLLIHLIAVFGGENRIEEKPTDKIPAFKRANIAYFPKKEALCLKQTTIPDSTRAFSRPSMNWHKCAKGI
jgi:hypothetical protein